MTEPAPSGGPSPLRVGGLALLGAGVVAALIGLATLLPNGSPSAPTTEAAPPATESAPATVPATETGQVAPPPSGSVPVPSFPTTTNAVAAPTVVPGGTNNGTGGGTGAGSGTGGGTGTGTGGGDGTAVPRSPVRVYNNSTIQGFAARAAADFRSNGWTVGQVANYPEVKGVGVIPTSTVYYRPGTSEQSSAEALARDFGLRVAPRFSGIDDASAGLIVIVTNDYQKR